jgi:hypothetical protein
MPCSGSGFPIPTIRRASMKRYQATAAALKKNRDTCKLNASREPFDCVDIVHHRAAPGSASRSMMERPFADVV